MKTPAFWSRPPGLLSLVLAPLGWLYGKITARRMARRGARAAVPVICVGNFTAGGTGKTPTVGWISDLVTAAALKPVILSRGYGGRLAGPVRVDPTVHNAADVGDEPLLLARHATVVIARDRPAGAATAADLGADLIIMDDGLQNPALAKDFAIAVVDGGTGIGNGMCIPAGPLRAPMEAQMPHVDAVLIIGEGPSGERVAQSATESGRPVYRAVLTPHGDAIAALSGKPLLAFAGIGRPEKFFDTLRAVGLDVRETRAFADHHAYGAAEADALRGEATAKALMLVTTEKDAVRFPGDVATLPVSLVFAETDGEAFARRISARTRSATSAP